MKENGKLKRAKNRLLTSALALSAAFAVGMPQVISAEAQQTSSEATPASSTVTVTEKHEEKTARTPEGAAGMRVNIDPNTGEIQEPPVGAPTAETMESLERAASTSSEGLVETPSPVPGGGVILDLQGRFRNPLVATQGADGKISTDHAPAVPGSGEKK